METRVYPCPVCGREANRGGEKFTDPSQTEAHIDGSHDAAHAEVSSDDTEIVPETRADGGEEMSSGPPEMPEFEDGADSTDDADSGSGDDSGGVTFIETDAPTEEPEEEDDGGLGVVALLVGIVIFIVAVGNSSESQNPTYGMGP